MLVEQDKIFLRKISLRFKKLRELNNLTQEDVLNDTGIHIGRIETGSRDFSISTLRKLAKYFNVSPAEILKGIR